MSQCIGVLARGKALSGTLFQSQSTSGSHVPVPVAIARDHRGDGRSRHLHDSDDVALAGKRYGCRTLTAWTSCSVRSRHH